LWDSLLNLDLVRLTSQCPKNTGLLGTNLYCDKCTDINCNACSGTAAHCDLCEDGWYLTPTNTCIT
jgi:hypothetical protein